MSDLQIIITLCLVIILTPLVSIAITAVCLAISVFSGKTKIYNDREKEK